MCLCVYARVCDKDLLDYYHIINALMPLYDIGYAIQRLHKTNYGRPRAIPIYGSPS